MGFFKWQDRYAFGIESIDNDHKGLVELINKLFDALSKGEARNVIKDIVDGLVGYSKDHFMREENFMKSIGYVEFDQHKLAHDDFVQKVLGFQKQLTMGQLNISVEVITFLRDWLIVHIQNMDKKYVADFNRFGIT